MGDDGTGMLQWRRQRAGASISPGTRIAQALIFISMVVGPALADPRPSRADIAPMEVAHHWTPAPVGGGHPERELFERQARIRVVDGEFVGDSTPPYVDLEPNVGVAMRSEHVVIDLYPTLMHVRASFELEATTRESSRLRVGFPEQLPRRRMTPLDRLRVEVDGRPVEATFAGAWQNAWDLEREDEPREDDHHWRAKSTGASAWWTWDMEVPTGRTVSVDVDYIQVLTGADPRDDEVRYFITYILQTGALWTDRIGAGTIELRLHGLDAAQVQFQGEVGERESLADAQVWRFSELEPTSDLWATLTLPVTRDEYGKVIPSDAEPTYTAAMDADMRLIDRLVRIHRGDSSADDWAEFLDMLDEARGATGEDAEFADALARDLAMYMAEPGVFDDDEQEEPPPEDDEQSSSSSPTIDPEAAALRAWVFDDAPWLESATLPASATDPQCAHPPVRIFDEGPRDGVRQPFGQECRSGIVARIAAGGDDHRGNLDGSNPHRGLVELRRRHERQTLGGAGAAFALLVMGGVGLVIRRRKRRATATSPR